MTNHLPASSPGSPFPGLLKSPKSTRELVGPSVRGGIQLPSPWPLELGGSLADARLAYELSGPVGAPVVLVLGGISSDRHIVANELDPTPGWWQPLTGSGRAIDTRYYRVLGIDFLGGQGASTGPCAGDVSTSRSAAQSSASTFPHITTTDQARALAFLVRHLGIGRVAAFVGSSYGGMVALAFAAAFPERVERLVVISAAAHSHPRATAWRSLQRKIVRLSRQHGVEKQGLILARGLAMTTYRTPEELAERFDTPPKANADGYRFPVEDYLEARGEAFAEAFGSEAFLCLSESIDLHRVNPQEITTPTTLVAAHSDQLVPCRQMEDLHRQLAGPSRLEVLDSVYGHDAFLKETDALTTILRGVLGDQELEREVA